MYLLGRTLQLFGLILLPAALLYGMSVGQSPGGRDRDLGALALGGLCFLIGTRLQGRR